MRVPRGPLGIPLLSMRGLRRCVNSGPEPEDFSQVLTWILGYFWSLPREVSNRLECGHALALSSRPVAAVSRSYPRGSKDPWFSLESFPRGFPTRLSHRAVPRAHVVGVDLRVERQAVQGKQVPMEWTDTSGGLLEWWHDPGVPLAFPVESATS